MWKRMLWIMLIFGFMQTANADVESPDELRIIDISQTVLQSTVKVTSNLLSHGSGFFVGKKEILTNYHVIESAKRLYIHTYQGTMCEAKLAYQDTKLDLVLLHTDCEGVPLAFNTLHQVGQTVITSGNPGIYDFVISKGIVSGKKFGLVQFDARITTGSSGGPLINLNGQVIGVVKAQDKEADYINFAISAQEATKFLVRARRVP